MQYDCFIYDRGREACTIYVRTGSNGRKLFSAGEMRAPDRTGTTIQHPQKPRYPDYRHGTVLGELCNERKPLSWVVRPIDLQVFGHFPNALQFTNAVQLEGINFV